MAMSLGIGLGLPFGGTVASGGAAPVTYQAESFPSTINLAHNVTTCGDSTVVGVGTSISPTDYSWPGQLTSVLTGGSLLRKETSGMAVETGGTGSNTNPIQTQFTGQGSTGLANNSQLFTGGLNDYNTGVQTEPNLQTWPSGVYTAIISNMIPTMTGGASQWWSYLLGTAEDNAGPGMRNWADWRYLKANLETNGYGSHVYDVRRLLISKATTNASDLDYIAVNEFWSVPLSLRGIGTALFANTAQTTMNTCTTATNTAAGVEAVAPAAGFNESDLIQNINSAAVLGNNIYRKSAAGSWVLVDHKHYSRWGYAYWEEAAIKLLTSIQSGCPCPNPGELFIAQDAAANTVAGTLYYSGAAPASVGLFDSTNTLVSTLTLTDNGSTNNAGSITVKRSASGTLTEGEQILTLQLTDGSGHVLHAPVDLRVGQPSTQTVPRMWTIPNSGGANSPLSDFSMMGRDVNGYSDGATFFICGWLNPSNIALAPYIIHHAGRTGTSSDLFVNIQASGAIKLVAHNAAGTLILNNQSGATCFADGSETWFAIDIDVSTSPATLTGYYNKAGAGDLTMSFGAAPAGGTTLAFSKMLPRFFAARDAWLANRWYSTADSVRSQYRGKFGNIILGNGNIGVATAANRRILWNTNGTPAARVPMSAINGQTPIYDIQGGIGDLQRGGFNQTYPVFGTRRGIMGLT